MLSSRGGIGEPKVELGVCQPYFMLPNGKCGSYRIAVRDNGDLVWRGGVGQREKKVADNITLLVWMKNGVNSYIFRGENIP